MTGKNEKLKGSIMRRFKDELIVYFDEKSVEKNIDKSQNWTFGVSFQESSFYIIMQNPNENQQSVHYNQLRMWAKLVGAQLGDIIKYNQGEALQNVPLGEFKQEYRDMIEAMNVEALKKASDYNESIKDRVTYTEDVDAQD